MDADAMTAEAPPTPPILGGDPPPRKSGRITPENAERNRAERGADYAKKPGLEPRDKATIGRGFKAWIEHVADDESYGDLKRAVRRTHEADVKSLPAQYDFEQWMFELSGEDDELNERIEDQLVKGVLEWKIDLVARGMADRVLEIDVVPKFDFHDPSMSSAQKCRYLNSTGTKCGAVVVPGTVRCKRHGGELVDAETRRAVLMTSYLQLVEASACAVETLVTVAKSGRNELARVAAAKEILDRAGLTPELQVSVRFEEDGRKGRLDELVNRLDAMQRGLTSRVIDAVGREVSPIDQPETEP